jgi:hypothetical protein
MFCADAKATPANSAAVLIRSLLLIGTVLCYFPARRAIGEWKTSELPRSSRVKHTWRSVSRLAINRHSSLREWQHHVAVMLEFRGTG